MATTQGDILCMQIETFQLMLLQMYDPTVELADLSRLPEVYGAMARKLMFGLLPLLLWIAIAETPCQYYGFVQTTIDTVATSAGNGEILITKLILRFLYHR